VAKRAVLVATILGSAIAFIDATAVNVALPVIQRELGADAAQMQWVVESYQLFLSALILLGGSLGDLYGRKRVFLAGTVVFALGSVGCAVAADVHVLVAARCVQGIGAALAVPQSLALISATFDGAERGRAIGTWSGFSAMTGAIGPVLGGVLAQHASWRWVFVINVPIALIVIAVAWRGVPESRDASAPRRLAVGGALLATAALAVLTYGLIAAQDVAHARGPLALIVLGLALLAAFIAVERRERAPMIPLDVFRSRTFSAANAYTLLLYAALGGSLYFLPYLLVDIQNYTPTAAGAAGLPFVVLMFSLSRWSGGLVARIGARTPLIVGALLAACGFLAYARPALDESYWTSYFPASLLLGLGASFFVAPLTTTVLAAVDTERSGIASGVNNAVARTAGLIAVAGLGIVLADVFDAGFDRRIAGRHVSARTAAIARDDRARLYAGTVPRDVPSRDRAAVEAAVRDGYLAGFRGVMLGSVVLCVLAAGTAALWIPRARGSDGASTASPSTSSG